ncbi:hypothetical protein ACFL07_08185 [Pseudomonadota bacterium]
MSIKHKELSGDCPHQFVSVRTVLLLVSVAAIISSCSVSTWISQTEAALSLRRDQWVEFVLGDVEKAQVRFSDVADTESVWIGASTLGTDSSTIKCVGVRSLEPRQLKKPATISWTLDWNEQANGSYLSAGLILSPTANDQPFVDANDWFQVSYIGVPPGGNARLDITASSGGIRKKLFNEGWPALGKEGRKIGVQQLELSISDSGVKFVENGQPVYNSNYQIDFDLVYVTLYLTSHSNYKYREVNFRDFYFSSKSHVRPILDCLHNKTPKCTAEPIRHLNSWAICSQFGQERPNTRYHH